MSVTTSAALDDLINAALALVATQDIRMNQVTRLDIGPLVVVVDYLPLDSSGNRYVAASGDVAGCRVVFPINWSRYS